MEELNRWRISRRHERCVVCYHVRDPTDWNGRCRWCAGHVCSEACFLQHDVECEERPPRDGGRDPEEVHDDLDASCSHIISNVLPNGIASLGLVSGSGSYRSSPTVSD